MMGRAEGPLGHQGCLAADHAHDGVNLRDFQGLFPGHIRQNGGQPFGQHTLAGAGRSDEQNIVTACRRDFHSPLHILLTQHILKVQDPNLRFSGDPQGFFLQNDLAVEAGSQLRYGMDRENDRSPSKGGFRSVFRGDK